MIALEIAKSLKYFYYLGFFIGILNYSYKLLYRNISDNEKNEYFKAIVLTCIFAVLIIEIIFYIISKIVNHLYKIYNELNV